MKKKKKKKKKLSKKLVRKTSTEVDKFSQNDGGEF